MGAGLGGRIRGVAVGDGRELFSSLDQSLVRKRLGEVLGALVGFKCLTGIVKCFCQIKFWNSYVFIETVWKHVK